MMQLRKSTAETQLGTDRAGAMNIRSADSVMEYLDPLEADLYQDSLIRTDAPKFAARAT